MTSPLLLFDTIVVSLGLFVRLLLNVSSVMHSSDYPLTFQAEPDVVGRQLRPSLSSILSILQPWRVPHLSVATLAVGLLLLFRAEPDSLLAIVLLPPDCLRPFLLLQEEIMQLL